MAAPGRPRKCDPEIEDLWMDIEYKRNEKVKSILERLGVDATDGDGRTALINATMRNNAEILKWVIAKGADVNFQDRIGYSALHFAAQNGAFDLAKILIENGANVNIQDVHGNIPLWTAMFNSKLTVNNITKLLLKHHSDTELNNNYDKNCRFMYQTFFKGDISTVDLSDI
ncbi:MAG: ankyrin repeat domain-containing protein [Bacteroidetes bacterium]|jgi:ankyrin repeat protein|nr:ankyrin repeat domain-containing protein [Bacteroidota bacterium]